MKRKLVSAVVGGALLLTACSNSAVTSSEKTQKNVDIRKVDDKLFTAQDKAKNPDKAKQRTDTFVAGISKPGGVFLPYFYHNGWDGNVTSPIFSSLITYDKSGKPIPQLAEKWDISSDGLIYTFHLRKGLTFSDGSPLTADDVAFTLQLLHDSAYDGETDISRAYIKGGQAYKEGKASTIDGIKVMDPQTVQVTTEKVSAQALGLLGGPVLSKAYYGKSYQQGHLDYLKDLYGKPLGAGPYKFDEYVLGQEVRYTANEHYYEGKPKIEHLIYKVTTPDVKLQEFQTGNTDYDSFPASEENLEQLKQLGFANINLYTSSAYTYIKVNNKKPYLKDKLVRQALLYGLDRKKVAYAALQQYGSVANEPISPVSWAYTDDVNKYEYNLQKAKDLLDQAGWKVGPGGIREKDGQKLKITYTTSTASTTPNDLFIPIAKENYQALGIEFNSEILDFNALQAKVQKDDYDLASFSSSTIIDPSERVEEFVSNSPLNKSGYANPKVDELVQEGVSTLDLQKRKEVYKKLYQALSDDPPMIFLYYRKTLSGTNARIQGLNPDPYNGIIPSLPTQKIIK